MPLSYPLALTPCLPAELLSYVLQQAHPTTLIICGSRTAFLSSLVEATSLPPPQPRAPQEPDPDLNLNPNLSQPPPPSRPEENDPCLLQPPTPPQLQPQPQPQPPPQRHPLLIPTLHQISLSRHTSTAFTPTVSHLRAYLSVFSGGPTTHQRVATDHGSARAAAAAAATAAQGPLLVVYGLVELHRGTSEWSTQGLGNTCAALVEAGRRSGRRVVLVEERPGGDDIDDDDDDGKREDGEEEEEEEDDDDGDDDGLGAARTRGDVRETRRKEMWREKLPILSGSVRRVGAEVEYGGRTVEVGMVLRRWFQFGRGEWEDG